MKVRGERGRPMLGKADVAAAVQEHQRELRWQLVRAAKREARRERRRSRMRSLHAALMGRR